MHPPVLNGPGPTGRRRLALLTSLVLVGAVAVFARLLTLQIFRARTLSRAADEQYYAKATTLPRRGTIFDRHGRPLTTDLGDFVTLGANPARIIRRTELAADLANSTGRAVGFYLARLEAKAQFVVLARKVAPEVADRLDRRGWNLIRQSDTRRFYPHHNLAAQTLGFIDVDSKGIAGIERTCQPLLGGEPGWRVVQLDVQGRQHLDGGLPLKAPVDGIDIALTIDLAIQTIVEEELAPALTIEKAQTASAVVLDPRSGEILALASLPGYDPNEPEESPAERQRVRPVTDLFEPGSTFKLVGAALLLEKGIARPTTQVDAGAGKIKVAGKIISDVRSHGVLSFKDVIAYSSNVGMVKLTMHIAPDDLLRMISRFGFLERTGVELDGEAIGQSSASASASAKAYLVIGHGIAVTMIQMAMAYGAIANDGVLMRPTLIKGRYASDGTLVEEPPLAVRQVVSKQTARTLSGFFVDVVERGTATRARIEGIKVAGKTGTAQKVKEQGGGYYPDRFNSSFIGYFPADDPQFLAMVLLDDPKGELHQGGQVAAPIFRRIAERIIGLNPDLRARNKGARGAAGSQFVTLPEVRYRSADQAGATLKKLGLAIRRHGEGAVVCDQVPSAGVRLEKGEAVDLTLGPAPRKGGGYVVVPYLTGFSLREAVKKASAAGLLVQFKGSGRVVRQMPASGTRAAVGDVLTLTAEG